MAARSTNTFSEILQRILSDVTQAMTMPDSDMDFLVDMQAQIIEKLRAPVTQMQDAGLLPQGAPGMGGAEAMAPQLPPGGGFMPQAAAPNADELRRLMSQQGG